MNFESHTFLEKGSQGKKGRDGQNWYVYVGNNPLSKIDPMGLWEEYIKNVVRSNLNSPYVKGTNDCDAWLENVVIKANPESTLKKDWGAATQNKIYQHIDKLKGKLTDELTLGTNIAFHNGNHAMLVALNDDGTVNVAHQTTNPDPTVKGEKEESVELFYKTKEEFLSEWGGADALDFYSLNDSAKIDTDVERPDGP